MNKASYEFFEHTADIGIRISAPTREELIHSATIALYEVIGSLVPDNYATPSTKEFNITGEETENLLHDYLTEILFLFENQSLMAERIHASKFTDCSLLVKVDFRPLDVDKSALHREVKAITYHELEITEVQGGFQATVIVDI